MKLALRKDKFIVTEVNLDHENHNTDQQTYDLYPENVRLTGEVLSKAEEMIEVGGNKKKIKMHLAKLTGKTVPMKTLNNIQTNMQKKKSVGADNQLDQLYNVLKDLPDTIVRFVSNTDDELVGNFVIVHFPVILFNAFVFE